MDAASAPAWTPCPTLHFASTPTDRHRGLHTVAIQPPTTPTNRRPATAFVPHFEAARLPQPTPPAPAVLHSVGPRASVRATPLFPIQHSVLSVRCSTFSRPPSLRPPRATHPSNPKQHNARQTTTLRFLRTELATSVLLRFRSGQPLVASSCGIPDAPLRSPSYARPELRSLRNTSSDRNCSSRRPQVGTRTPPFASLRPLAISALSRSVRSSSTVQSRTASLHTRGISQSRIRVYAHKVSYIQHCVVFLADASLAGHKRPCVAPSPWPSIHPRVTPTRAANATALPSVVSHGRLGSLCSVAKVSPPAPALGYTLHKWRSPRLPFYTVKPGLTTPVASRGCPPAAAPGGPRE